MQTEQFQLHHRMEETHWWFNARREILKRLIRRLLPPQGQLIADIGCGTGGNLGALAADYRCFGWDPSEEAVKLARRKYPSVVFHTGPLEQALSSLPQPPDLILANDVLEHVEGDREFLSKLVELLNPGGHLLITVPAGMELWSPHDVNVGHFRRYTRPQLEKLWADEPVEARLVSYFNARLYPVVRCVRMLTRKTGRAAGEAQTDFKTPPAPVNRLLERIFAGEASVLSDLLDHKRSNGFTHGVSLIALLQKKEPIHA